MATSRTSSANISPSILHTSPGCQKQQSSSSGWMLGGTIVSWPVQRSSASGSSPGSIFSRLAMDSVNENLFDAGTGSQINQKCERGFFSRPLSTVSGRSRSATMTATGLSRSTSTIPVEPPSTKPTLRPGTKK
jgi:hypothetical protein